MKDFSSLPRNKEELERRQKEVREFHTDIAAHSEPLDQVETNGSSFLSSAKVPCYVTSIHVVGSIC